VMGPHHDVGVVAKRVERALIELPTAPKSHSPL